MGIAEWQIVLEATIAVGMVSYGIWLKYIIDQQLKTKDTAMQALEAALKSKDAEISRLQTETAPAIAAKYKTMREYADHITEESHALTKKVEELSATPSRGVTYESNKEIESNKELLNEASGLIRAAEIIGEETKTLAGTEPELAKPSVVLVTILSKIRKEIESNHSQVRNSLKLFPKTFNPHPPDGVR